MRAVFSNYSVLLLYLFLQVHNVECQAQQIVDISKILGSAYSSYRQINIHNLTNDNHLLATCASPHKENYKTLLDVSEIKSHQYHIEPIGDFLALQILACSNHYPSVFFLSSYNSLQSLTLLHASKPNDNSKWAVTQINTNIPAVNSACTHGKFLVLNSGIYPREVSNVCLLSDTGGYLFVKKLLNTHISAINKNGIACGKTKRFNHYSPCIYMYEKDTSILFLSNMEGYATDINDRGEVCGVYFTADGQERGFVWDYSSMQKFSLEIPFTDINPDIQTVPMHINNNGVIVGRSKGDYIYRINERCYPFGVLLKQNGYNVKITDIVSLTDEDECIIKTYDPASQKIGYLLVKIK